MRFVTILTFLSFGLVAAPSAGATPSNVRIEVYLASSCPAAQGACPQGKSPSASKGVGGVLRMKASAQDALGLRRIRIEGRQKGTQRWYCIAERDARGDGVSSEMWFDWDSSIWPSPEKSAEQERCSHTLPHIHGTPTPNGAFEVRAAAISLANDQDETDSSATGMILLNRAQAPGWAEEPSVSAEARTVGLSWTPNPEPDLVSYEVVRRGPDGTVRRQIDAQTPEKSGCSRIGTTAIRCSDKLGSAGGDYIYQLVALRPGGNIACLKSRCIASQPSSKKAVAAASSETGGSSNPEPTASETGSEGTPPDAVSSTTPPVSSTPTADATATADGIPVTSKTSGGSAMLPLAAIAAIGAALAGWLLARKRRASSKPN